MSHDPEGPEGYILLKNILREMELSTCLAHEGLRAFGAFGAMSHRARPVSGLGPTDTKVPRCPSRCPPRGPLSDTDIGV